MKVLRVELDSYDAVMGYQLNDAKQSRLLRVPVSLDAKGGDIVLVATKANAVLQASQAVSIDELVPGDATCAIARVGALSSFDALVLARMAVQIPRHHVILSVESLQVIAREGHTRLGDIVVQLESNREAPVILTKEEFNDLTSKALAWEDFTSCQK